MRIAIGNKKRVGKDTCAEYIKKHYFKDDCLVISFSEKLYEIMYNLQDSLGLERHKDRDMLIVLGNMIRRYDNDFFVNIVKQKILDNLDKNIIVTDLRFTNEASMLKSLGFVCVNISRHHLINAGNNPLEIISETELDNFVYDYYIKNYGTLQEFYDKIDSVMSNIIETAKLSLVLN